MKAQGPPILEIDDDDEDDYDDSQPPPDEILCARQRPDLNLWGMPISDVKAIQPPLLSPEFQWSQSELSTAEPPEECVLRPAPSEEAPLGFVYPEAKSYNLIQDNRYRRGWIYRADFDPLSKSEHKVRLLCSIVHPNIHAKWDENNNKFQLRPVPGMIRLVPGIPIVERPIHCPDHVITAVVLHTLDSVMQYEEGTRIRELADDLRLFTFGHMEEEGPGQKTLKPIYEHLVVRNDRSVKAKNLPKGSFDGSYNLAGTNQKGQGQGCFAPAVQTTTPEAQGHMSRVLQLLNELRQLIFRISLSKFENDTVDFLHEDNNIFSAGGLHPGGTGVQCNCSSVCRFIVVTGDANLKKTLGDLGKSIGAKQGGPHTDKSDDPTQNTLGILMVKLPPGKFHSVHAFLDAYMCLRIPHWCIRLSSPCLLCQRA